MAGNNPAPWLASSPVLLANPLVEHIYTVRMFNGGLGGGEQSYTAVPAYAVRVTLDATRVPFGEATFRTPLPPWPGIDWPQSNLKVRDAGWKTIPVEIKAGYRNAGAADLQVLMFGQVTQARVHRSGDTGGGYIDWTVQTCEMQWEYPSHRTYTPSNTYTRVKQAIDAVNGSADPWYVKVAIQEYSLNTPTAGQLTNFRACDIAIGDTVGDYLRQLAQLLGQRLRPEWRVGAGTANSVRFRIEPEPAVNTGTALALTAVAEANEAHGEAGGTVLNMNAKWYSGGDQKTANRLFWPTAEPWVQSPVAPTTGTTRAVPAEATVYTKPPGGAVPNDATWPPVALWRARIVRQASRYSFTARAAYWLQPFDAITAADHTGAAVTIGLDSITFDLDAGLMTTTGFRP